MAIDIVTTIRENLRRRITESGYPSFERFAYENAIDKTTLSRILNGKREPKISTLFKIVDSLNLTLNDLYLAGNQVREKTPSYSTGSTSGSNRRIKSRKITLMVVESDLAALQEKLKSSKPLVLEARVVKSGKKS